MIVFTIFWIPNIILSYFWFLWLHGSQTLTCIDPFYMKILDISVFHFNRVKPLTKKTKLSRFYYIPCSCSQNRLECLKRDHFAIQFVECWLYTIHTLVWFVLQNYLICDNKKPCHFFILWAIWASQFCSLYSKFLKKETQK